MNYQKICDQIIERGKLRGLSSKKQKFFERHHIIPKCFGGTNENHNLVDLTPREHFIVHWLLKNIHGGKMSWAWFRMCHPRSKGTKHIATSRQYEFARIAISKATTQRLLGKKRPGLKRSPHSIETRKRISLGNRGKKLSNESKKYLREIKLGVPNSAESKKKNSDSTQAQWNDPVKRQKLIQSRIKNLIQFAENVSSMKGKTTIFMMSELSMTPSVFLDKVNRTIRNQLMTKNDLPHDYDEVMKNRHTKLPHSQQNRRQHVVL